MRTLSRQLPFEPEAAALAATGIDIRPLCRTGGRTLECNARVEFCVCFVFVSFRLLNFGRRERRNDTSKYVLLAIARR